MTRVVRGHSSWCFYGVPEYAIMCSMKCVSGMVFPT